ncbi:hypothetical protein BPJM79_30287 [Bacillus pumilus]
MNIKGLSACIAVRSFLLTSRQARGMAAGRINNVCDGNL